MIAVRPEQFLERAIVEIHPSPSLAATFDPPFTPVLDAFHLDRDRVDALRPDYAIFFHSDAVFQQPIPLFLSCIPPGQFQPAVVIASGLIFPDFLVGQEFATE